MKMQSKLLLLALGPLVALGVIVVMLSNVRITEVVTDSIENSLRATAISVNDTLNYADEGDYALNKNGKLCKGEFNITDNIDIAEHIKEDTQIEVSVFFGKIRYMTSILGESGRPIVGTRATEEVATRVMQNEESFFSSEVDIYGKKYYGYYMPLYNAGEGKPVGMLFAGMPQADARAQIFSILGVIAGIVVVVGLLAAAVLAMVVRKLVVAIRKGTTALESVAKGHLNVQVDSGLLGRKDEIGNISRAIKTLREELSEVIGIIKQQGEELNQAAAYLHTRVDETTGSITQVERAVNELAQGANGQAQETQTTTDNVIQIGDMVEATAKEAESMQGNATNMHTMGKETFEVLHELQQTNDRAKSSIDEIYVQTNTTNQSALKIKEATSLIASIADETNLLSLNATIEAARAGEQGRGFAVVATQIQKLAEQSNASAQQIEEIISTLIADSNQAVQTMNVVKDIMDKQNQNVRMMDERFAEVLNGIEESIAAIGRIAGRTEEMDNARVSVVDTVQNLTAIAEENAASTEQTSASISEIADAVADISERAQNLKGIADRLENSMERFEL